MKKFSGTASECILVVDDQAANIQAVGTLLRSMDYDVMAATDADQALQRMTARLPDLILLDMMMPGVNGLDLCRRLQSRMQWADIPVIFLSAAGEVNIITAALEAGAVDYVTKPFHRAELLSRIRTHLALKSARNQLRRVAAEREELLGLIAHDFKNHLAAMQFHAEYLTKHASGLSKEAAGCVKTITRESERMARCVGDLLANAAVERQPLQLEVVAAAEIASEATTAIQSLADAKEHTVALVLPEAPVSVRADKTALRQVLDNLLSNAVKFSPPGGRSALTIVAGPDEVQFSVSDSGPGFTEGDIARAFQRFARLSARPTAGESSTGLGLSIVKTLIGEMGGTVTIEPGQAGGRCTVRLPRVLS
jgi:two-component system sensor histidine kinase/response regulator